MANWFWDLGLDLNAVVNGNQRFLPNGLVLMGISIDGATRNVPATPINISTGDTIGFNLFNITNPLPTDTITLISASIAFQKAVQAQASTSPFSFQSVDFTTPSNPGMGMSVIFSGTQVFPVVTHPVQFPFYYGPGTPTVANEGRFLVSFSATVQVGNGPLMNFQGDAEMIVGSAA